jgi:hypothetical protein
MIEVHSNLFVGTVDEAVTLPQKDWKKIFAANNFHYQMHGWTRGGRYQNHPYYVIHEEADFISLNWVDGPANYFDYQGKGVEIVQRVLTFIDNNLPESQIIIACNQGKSRSPSLALVYLAKRLHVIADTSYEDARRDFLQKYPRYEPSGIADFLSQKWENL